MIKIIREFWELKDKMRGKRIALLFFCSQFYDIIWYREFLRLQESVNWFHYFPVLTRPTERCNWKGKKANKAKKKSPDYFNNLN